MKTVLLIGSLDTKGEEYAYARQLLRERKMPVQVIDFSIMGEPGFPVDIGANEVAEAGGSSLDALRKRRDRGSAMDVMTAGVQVITRREFERGHVHAVLGMGGGGGTSVITAAMRTLPVGLPKVMLSTMASGDVRPYVDVKDITMMYSVVDVAGLNPISRALIRNAVGAVCGMLEGSRVSEVTRRKPLIAATMFGVTTPCVAEARNRLEEKGLEVVTFHATGSGGRAMEGLIDDGYFEGVLDVTTTEWCDEIVGGVLSAGPDRHGAAARRGVPQVVSVGALDMVNFGAMDTVPSKFQGRRFYKHNPQVTLMRTTPDECREIGKRMAAQLNKATAPVVLLLPLRGVSMIDDQTGPFRDDDANRELFASLKQHCAMKVRIKELDAHVNDTEFAHALADEMIALMQ
jgi:uncharacterized protein (UPF0261 family)